MKIDKRQFLVKTIKNPEIYYTLIGQEDYLDDNMLPIKNNNDDSVYAKISKNKPSRSSAESELIDSYFIKANTKKEPINPISIHSSIKNKPINSYIDKVCKQEWSFVEVNYSTFIKYVSFLKTKDLRLLNQVYRDIK